MRLSELNGNESWFSLLHLRLFTLLHSRTKGIEKALLDMEEAIEERAYAVALGEPE